MGKISLEKPQLATVAFSSIDASDVSVLKMESDKIIIVTNQGNRFIVAQDEPEKIKKPVGEFYNKKLSVMGPSVKLRAIFERAAAAICESGHHLTRLEFGHSIEQKVGTRPAGMASIGESKRRPNDFYFNHTESWVNESNVRSIVHEEYFQGRGKKTEIIMRGSDRFSFDDTRSAEGFDLNSLLARAEERAQRGELFKHVSGINYVTPHRPGDTQTTYLQLDDVGEMRLTGWARATKLSAVFTNVKQTIRDDFSSGERFEIGIFPLANEAHPENIEREFWEKQREREIAVALRDIIRELRPEIKFVSENEDCVIIPR